MSEPREQINRDLVNLIEFSIGLRDPNLANLADRLNANVCAAHAAEAARIADLEAENKELRCALRALRKGLTADADGEFWSARRFLDERGVYNGDLSGERVLEEVAKVALKKSAAPAVSSPDEP